MSTLESDAVPDSTLDTLVAPSAAGAAADAAGPEGDVAQAATSDPADDLSADAPAPRESTLEPVENSVVSDLRIDENAPHPVTPPAPVVEPVQVAVRPGSRSYEDEPPQAPEATTEEPENKIQFGPQGPRRKRGNSSGNGGLELPSVGPSAQGAMRQSDSSTFGLPPLGGLPSLLPTGIKDPETSVTTDPITGTVLPSVQPRTNAQLITDTTVPSDQPAPLPGTQLSLSDAPSSSFRPSARPVLGMNYAVTSNVGVEPVVGSQLQRQETNFATGYSMTEQHNNMRLQQSSMSPGMAVKVAIAVSLLLVHDVLLMLIVVAAARADVFDSFGDDDDKYTSERFNTRAAEAAWAAQPPPIPAIAGMQEVDSTVVISTAADPSSSIKFTDAQGHSMLDLSSDGEVTMTTTSTNSVSLVLRAVILPMCDTSAMLPSDQCTGASKQRAHPS
ncbi:hypothetical protein CYMTET_20235 [Cymbomonas tetramitiformis]|uniref:Uncharacterized protein n=1 Tax=Cymbomonas tetramitiformis TaxID=36881 RepID=A0AAE0L464_9CHLO|nr:hypothetical protein CYMTET_20235 [Cymbomonas tetramitiformis]